MAAPVDVSAQLTLIELAKRTNNKETLDIATNLSKLTPVLQDAYWKEANMLTAHKHTRGAALAGTGTWRDVNEGVSPTAGQTEQVVEPIGYLEDRSEIDELLVKLAPDPRQYRYDEDLLHLEGLAQTIETAFWYSNIATAPKAIQGVVPRYNGLSLTPDNVSTAGGTTNLTSAYFIKWGPDGVYMVYPKNAMNLGIERNDKGLELITTTAPARLYKWVTQFVFNIGLCVRDHRCVQRLANINAVEGAAANIIDENKLIQGYEQIPGSKEGTILYMNKRAKIQLAIKAKDKPNVIWTTKDPFGRPVTMFWDVPIHASEMITIAETRVV